MSEVYLKPKTMLGRLLAEISWEGNASKYHEGGRGLENVLTAEVWQAIDLLPRKEFLGRVVKAFHGGDIEKVRSRLLASVENVEFDLLPGAQFLAAAPVELQTQPDAIINGPGFYGYLEAKRLRSASFEPEQLARELVAVCRDAGDRLPVLLLVLPKPPPVLVRGQGRLEVREAIEPHLASVLQRTQNFSGTEADMLRAVESTVAWITWAEIRRVVVEQVAAFSSGSISIDGSVRRLAALVEGAIKWHGPE